MSRITGRFHAVALSGGARLGGQPLPGLGGDAIAQQALSPPENPENGVHETYAAPQRC